MQRRGVIVAQIAALCVGFVGFWQAYQYENDAPGRGVEWAYLSFGLALVLLLIVATLLVLRGLSVRNSTALFIISVLCLILTAIDWFVASATHFGPLWAGGGEPAQTIFYMVATIMTFMIGLAEQTRRQNEEK